MEYQVHLGLKSGQRFSFFLEAKSKEEIYKRIKNLASNDWFSFMGEHSIEHHVLKSEIVFIGIGQIPDEISL
jgi:hypothetical protein